MHLLLLQPLVRGSGVVSAYHAGGDIDADHARAVLREGFGDCAGAAGVVEEFEGGGGGGVGGEGGEEVEGGLQGGG